MMNSKCSRGLDEKHDDGAGSDSGVESSSSESTRQPRSASCHNLGKISIDNTPSPVKQKPVLSKAKRGSLWNLFHISSKGRSWSLSKRNSESTTFYIPNNTKGNATKVIPENLIIPSVSAADSLSKTSDLGDSIPTTPVSTIGCSGLMETPGKVGMHNLGNTCYFNSILQCLAHVDVFSEYFAMDDFIDDLISPHKNCTKKNKYSKNNNTGELTYMLAQMIKSLWQADLYSIDICREFHEVLGYYGQQYGGVEQQDAQEFFMWLIDKVHEESIKAPRKKPKDLKVKFSVFLSFDTIGKLMFRDGVKQFLFKKYREK